MSKSFSNQMYMDHGAVQQAGRTGEAGSTEQGRVPDPYSSRDSGFPGSLERNSGAQPVNGKDPSPTQKRVSAFESYKKPDSNSSPINDVPVDGKPQTVSATNVTPSYSAPVMAPNGGIPGHKRTDSLASSESHTVVATARGVFDSIGGVLESKDTGVSIIIPKDAIPEGVKQEIYFKVCQDNSILPPLDKDKGETLLSPLVMCGPHGLKFLQPVELRLPHWASVNPESWSFALKSSDSPTSTGQPTHWQNMTLAGIDGVSQGRVGKSSVSVLVDHF